MNNKNIFWIIAGIINLLTTLLHTIGGQLDLINPLLESGLENEVKTQLLGVWHMVTIILATSSYLLLYSGFKNTDKKNVAIISLIAYLYMFFSLVFILISFVYSMLVPQWILLLPIGVLTLIGLKKGEKNSMK